MSREPAINVATETFEYDSYIDLPGINFPGRFFYGDKEGE